MTTTGFVWLVREVAVHVRPLLVDGGAFFSFIDWRQWPNLVGAVESANYRINKMIVWDKETFGMGNGFRNQHELVLFASKGVPNIAEADTPDVLACKREENTWHPSPKPVPLMERLLRVAVKPGGIVLDPFMGAGSTGVAALRLGMRFIGIELDENHCRTARERLRAEETSSTLEAREAGQTSLFGGARP
jgi:site-specific DNA-methyltransferase (adenine-specific)